MRRSCARYLRSDAGSACFFVPGCGGHEVWISQEDVEFFLGRSWYVHRDSGGKLYVYCCTRPPQKLHRLLLGLQRGIIGDHQDGDGLNNRRSNLRPATARQNSQNSARANITGYKGVWLHVSGLFGGAVKDAAGRRRSIGYYRTAIEAARAHDVLALAFHGKFARLNFPADLMSPNEIRGVAALRKWADPVPVEV